MEPFTLRHRPNAPARTGTVGSSLLQSVEHPPVPPAHPLIHPLTSGVTSVRHYSFCGYASLLEIEALTPSPL